MLKISNGAKIYLSGPMSGCSELNRPAFHAAEHKLREWGYEPINPFALNTDSGLNDESKNSEYMRSDIRALTECDAIYMLVGWWKSPGAKLELEIALRQACTVFFEEGC